LQHPHIRFLLVAYLKRLAMLCLFGPVNQIALMCLAKKAIGGKVVSGHFNASIVITMGQVL